MKKYYVIAYSEKADGLSHIDAEDLIERNRDYVEHGIGEPLIVLYMADNFDDIGKNADRIFEIIKEKRKK